MGEEAEGSEPRGEINVKAQMNARLAELGMGLEELSTKTGDGYRNVQRWVREGTAPPADFLARFCEATNTSADWLLLGLGGADRLPASAAEELLRQIRALLTSADASDRKRRSAEMRAARDRQRKDEAGPELPPYNEGRSKPRRRRGA